MEVVKTTIRKQYPSNRQQYTYTLMAFISVMSFTQSEVDELAKRTERYEEYERISAEVENDSDGLLDHLAASYVAADSMGIDLTSPVPVKDLRHDMSATVFGFVASEPTIKEYRRKSGGPGRMMRFALRDGTGEIDVVIWDEKTVDELTAADIVEGTRIKMANGKVRENQYGRQISPGRWGAVVLEPDDYREMADTEERQKKIQPISDISVGGTYSVKGEIMVVFELREFRRRSGSAGHVLNVIISDPGSSVKIVLWDGLAVSNQYLERGQFAVFRDMNARQNGDVIELHSSYRSSVEIEAR